MLLGVLGLCCWHNKRRKRSVKANHEATFSPVRTWRRPWTPRLDSDSIMTEVTSPFRMHKPSRSSRYPETVMEAEEEIARGRPRDRYSSRTGAPAVHSPVPSVLTPTRLPLPYKRPEARDRPLYSIGSAVPYVVDKMCAMT